jgi:flagellar biosynthetic protein FliP
MSQQIERSNNADAVWMFVEYQRPAKNSLAAESWEEPQTYDDVPLTVLLPAYLLSELKTAFLIGFQIYLPFLIIDLVVASVLMSMGLPMLSPTQVSLPFKLLLFVLIDGWTLTVGMLIESVRA